jgi:hypothetical protein
LAEYDRLRRPSGPGWPPTVIPLNGATSTSVALAARPAIAGTGCVCQIPASF